MPEQSGISDYVRTTMKNRLLPDDPYKHQYALLDSDEEDITEFNKIAEKRILLANISDDKMMRFYQNDLILLCQMLDMAKREPQLRNFFLKTYYGWVGELSLTRAKDGLERRLQATAGGYNPKENLGGYGSNLWPAENKDEKNFFQKIFNRDKKPKIMGGGPQ